MSQSESTDHEKILQVYRTTLERIQTSLESGLQLRKMNDQVNIDFIQDLVRIGEEARTLNNETGFHNLRLADLTYSFCVNIRKAIIELNLASDVLDWEGKLEARGKDISLIARRDFYKCLKNCPESVPKALQDPRKWRT
jgi:hypothetical protein